MTTAHIALLLRPALIAAALCPLILLSACAELLKDPEHTRPSVLRAPYQSGRDVVIGVAPLRNESGTSTVDELAITDRLVEALTQIEGVVALPTNRSVAAMRSLAMPRVATPGDARQLADQLGADGLVVGTITSYDPYDPPRLGMSIVLHASPGPLRRSARSNVVDPIALQRAASDAGITVSDQRDLPVAAYAEIVDANNHAVLMDLKRYATGRHDINTAMGWKIYLKSATRFAEYVGFRAARSLMESEARRLIIEQTPEGTNGV